MTNTLADLITELRTRAKVCSMVGDNTQASLISRAADALHALNNRVDQAMKAERLRIAAEIRHIGPDFDADDYVEMLEAK